MFWLRFECLSSHPHPLPFSTLKMLLYCVFISMVPNEKSTIFSIFSPLYVMYHFSLNAFNICFLFIVFSGLITMCLGRVFFFLNLSNLWLELAEILKFVFDQIWAFFWLLFHQVFLFALISFYFPSRTLITFMLDILMVVFLLFSFGVLYIS